MMDTHIASAFDRDLEGIQASIMKMGGLVEEAIVNAATSLETRDEERAEAVRRPGGNVPSCSLFTMAKNVNDCRNIIYKCQTLA